VRLKSYFSGTVEAAIQLARQELGAEALLVNARPATPENRYLGAYEVVFGTRAGPIAATPPPLPVGNPADSRVGNLDALSRDVAGLWRAVERLSASLPEVVLPEVEPETPPTLSTDAALGLRGAGRAVVAFVGPPGVGKTTTLIKLAAHFGLAEGRSTQVLSADVYRIGAADQLRRLATILGIGCTVTETPLALEQALDEHRSKQLVLIDTPGWSYRELEEGSGLSLDLARVLAFHPEMDTHLLLAASMNPADIAAAAEHYAVFRPGKLILTRVDETANCRDALKEIARFSLPVSFLTTGQRIPDDIEPASEERLVELTMSARPPQCLGAAA